MTAARAALAVIGAGQIGRRHIECVIAEPAARLTAIVDPHDDARFLAGRIGVPWFATIADLLEREEVDGAIVATPTQLHAEQALALVAAGVATLVEKPIADDVAQARRLVSAAAARGVPLLVGHHRRHNPIIREARAIIAAGRLGRIVAVHGSFWVLKPEDYFAPTWRRLAGAGPILTNLIHDVDLLRHLVGEIASVQALSSRMIRGHEVEETAVVLLRFADGALGTLTASDTVVAPWSWEHTAGENASYPRTDQSCYQIGGTHGSLSIPDLAVWTNPARRGWLESFVASRSHAAVADPLRLQVAHFVRVIRGEEAVLVSGADGLAALEVIDAVRRAAECGDQVRIGAGGAAR